MTHDQIVAALQRGYQLDDARESRGRCYPIRKPTPRPKLRHMPDAPLSPDKPDATGFGDREPTPRPRSRYERRYLNDGQRRARTLARWRSAEDPGNLIELFGPRSFALIFVLLMALPALPLPPLGLRTSSRL